MTANTPIPLDAFVAELKSLDSDDFAALVGEAYAATADAVAVDPPRITVTDGDRRTELVVASAAAASERAEGADAVVTTSGESLEDLGLELDAEIVTPADLRQRLLYAVPPAKANAMAERTLGLPVRSAAYEGAAAGGGGESASGGREAVGDDGEAASGDREAASDDAGTDETDDETGPGDVAVADDGSSATAARGAVATSSPTGRSGSGSEGPSSRDKPTKSSAETDPSGDATATGAAADATATDADDDDASERPDRRTIAAVVVVAALLVAAAGAGFAAGIAGLVSPDALASAGDDGTTDPSATDSDEGRVANGSDDGTEGTTGDGDATNTVDVADGDPTGEAARNTAPRPTCNRSALQVVQIQMNALRYNDDATNDGIRTLRAFASPENRDAVGSVEQYAELFETERYGPMLTYDTAEYSVPTVDGDAAEVDVVTRENGTVSGRYEFRLVRVPGGSEGSDTDLGDVDGCWMTDTVAASTE